MECGWRGGPQGGVLDDIKAAMSQIKGVTVNQLQVHTRYITHGLMTALWLDISGPTSPAVVPSPKGGSGYHA